MCRPGRPCHCDLTAAGAAAVHAVDAPMAARTPGGMAGAALQASAFSASLARAATADPVPQTMAPVPSNWASTNYPGAPWRVAAVILPDTVAPNNALVAPTRTNVLNQLLGSI